MQILTVLIFQSIRKTVITVDRMIPMITQIPVIQIPETTEITIRDILLMTGTLMTLLIQILHREMIQEILVIYPIMILVMLLMMVRIPVTILIRTWMTVVPEIPEMIP